MTLDEDLNRLSQMAERTYLVQDQTDQLMRQLNIITESYYHDEDETMFRICNVGHVRLYGFVTAAEI